MSDLIAIAFKDEHTALEARNEIAKLSREYLIDLDDVVVVTRDEKGHVKLHQAVNTTTAGAVSGGFWGLLIGFIFSIPFFGIGALLLPLMGAAVGAAAGAAGGALTDLGISDQFVKEVSENLTPGTSAIFLLVNKMTEDRVMPAIASFDGTVLRTNLSDDAEARLRQELKDAHDKAVGASPAGDQPTV